MRVVMPDFHHRQSHRLSGLRRAISGVGVHGDDGGPVIEKCAIVGHGAGEFVGAERIVKVAQMVAEKRLAILHEADRTLHLPAQCQNLGRGGKTRRQGQRARHAPPCAPQGHGRAGPFDAVIQSTGNVAVVHQEAVGKGGKLLPRFVIADDLRFARQVAAGHHQRTAESREKQMVKWRVGQHHAESGHPRRDIGRKGQTRCDQNHRCRRIAQEGKVCAAHFSQSIKVALARHQARV